MRRIVIALIAISASPAYAQDYQPLPAPAPDPGALTVKASPNGVQWLNDMLGMSPSFLSSDGTINSGYVAGAQAPATPASSSEPCAAGTIKADASYIYVCVGPNTWARSALGAF